MNCVLLLLLLLDPCRHRRRHEKGHFWQPNYSTPSPHFRWTCGCTHFNFIPCLYDFLHFTFFLFFFLISFYFYCTLPCFILSGFTIHLCIMAAGRGRDETKPLAWPTTRRLRLTKDRKNVIEFFFRCCCCYCLKRSQKSIQPSPMRACLNKICLG